MLDSSTIYACGTELKNKGVTAALKFCFLGLETQNICLEGPKILKHFFCYDKRKKVSEKLKWSYFILNLK